MTDPTDLRYETKLVLRNSEFPRFQNWMHRHTAVAAAHPDRFVNSVYFDTFRLSCVRDNIIGLPNRKKYRLRWYQDEDARRAHGLSFEVKQRINRAGRKETVAIPDPCATLLSRRLPDLAREVEKCIPHNGHVPLECLRNPTLHVSYRRSYYTVGHGIRLTIDSDILFYDLLSSTRLYQRAPYRYPKHVVEFKFPVSLRDQTASVLQTANFSPVRHSKYVVGLATFGYVVYI